MFRRFRADERGATTIEYALLCSLIAVGAIGAVGRAGEAVTGLFSTVTGRTGAVAAIARTGGGMTGPGSDGSGGGGESGGETGGGTGGPGGTAGTGGTGGGGQGSETLPDLTISTVSVLCPCIMGSNGTVGYTTALLAAGDAYRYPLAMTVTASPTVVSGAAITGIQVQHNGVTVPSSGTSFSIAYNEKGTYTVQALLGGRVGPAFSFTVQ